MAYNDLQESLETLPSMLDHIVGESVCENLAGQWWDCNPSALALQYIAEVLEVRVSAPDNRIAQFEGWDVCSRVDFVRGVHVPR